MMFIVSCALVLVIAVPLADLIPRLGLPPAIFIGITSALFSAALTILFVRWDGIGLADVGAMPNPGSVPRLVLGLGLGLILVALHSFLQAAFGHVRWVRVPGVGATATGLSLLTYLALACREELAFHGYPLRRMASRYGLWGAQLLIATVFAAEHVLGGWTWMNAIAGAGVGSVLFGMASLATRGLAVPIGLHAAWNFGDWVRGGKESTGFWTPVVDTGFESNARLVGQVSYVVLLLAATIAFWVWRRVLAGVPLPPTTGMDVA
jgi:membrane protease YdiL (CAAX protease family)